MGQPTPSTMRAAMRLAQASRASTSAGQLVGADAVGKDFTGEREKVADHAGHSAETWRKISYYVCLPLIAVYGIHIYNEEKAHAEHAEHLKEENGGEMPEKKVYTYMNVRKKAFPWGPQTIFFNPEVNAPASDEV